MSEMGIRVHCTKLNIVSCADCLIIDSHEGQKAYSQTGTNCPLPDLWCEVGREMRTQHGTRPDTATSRPTPACSGLNVFRRREPGQ